MNAPAPIRLAWATVLVAAVAAIAADAVSTYAALSSSSHRYAEATAATTSLIATLGLSGGIAATVLLRLAGFALAAYAALSYPRIALPLLAIVALGAAYTGLLAVGNLEALAR